MQNEMKNAQTLHEPSTIKIYTGTFSYGGTNNVLF